VGKSEGFWELDLTEAVAGPARIPGQIMVRKVKIMYSFPKGT
jgi:hypothetical protein